MNALDDAAVDPRDPVAIARVLVACRSVTGEPDGGAQALLARLLAAIGFTVEHVPFGPPGGETPNLVATLGDGGPHLGFAGHTDVVPPGPETAWSVAPFAGTVRDGRLVGRGACDMKGGIAAFIAAVAAHRDGRPTPGPGTITLVVTGDEEGPGDHGTGRVVEWLRARDRLPAFCLVGEPTNPSRLGETIKIGRRGSLNARIVVEGLQGHAAYPGRASNPVHPLAAIVADLTAAPLDEATRFFEPSGLQVTSIDVGNPARNVIPGRAEALLNIRFNDRQTADGLGARLRAVAERHAPGRAHVTWTVGAEPFVTEPAREIDALRRAIGRVTGCEPALDTGGGTSDARFFAPHCRVAEFGLVGATMHQADESVPVEDLRALAAIYRLFLDEVMSGGEAV